MQIRTFKLVGLVGVFAAMSAASVVACSDDSAQPQAPDAGQQCGATVVSMHDQECSEDGLECPVTLACGTGNYQTAICTCANGKFRCNDGTFNADGSENRFNGGKEPTCADKPPVASEDCDPADTNCTLLLPSGARCGDSFEALDAQECAKADISATCNFTSDACPGQSVGAFDTCVCRLGTADPNAAPPEEGANPNAAKWSCVRSRCDQPETPSGSSSGGSSGTSSGGSSSGGSDAGADAAAED